MTDSPQCDLSIAVLLPVFNRHLSVVEALDSIAAQTHPPTRVVVVDDGSQDQTPQVVRDYFARALPFEATLFEQSNAGPGAARNRAAKAAADADVLALLDSDDLWPVDFLARVHAAFEASPDAVAVTADYLRIHSDTGVQQRIDCAWIEQGEPAIRFFTDPHAFIATPSTAIRRSAFETLGGYDPTTRYCEDTQIVLRLSLAGAWRHLPGDPIQVRLGDAAHAGQAPHVSILRPERTWWVARVFETFIQQDGGDRVVPERIWRPCLARLWYRAGRKYVRLGDRPRARACFEQSLTYRPLHFKSRYWIWRLRGCTPNRAEPDAG